MPDTISGKDCMVFVLMGERGHTEETFVSKGATRSARPKPTQESTEKTENSVLPNDDTLSLLQMDGEKVTDIYPLCVGNKVTPSAKPKVGSGWSDLIIMENAMEPEGKIPLGAEFKLGHNGKNPNAKWVEKSVTAWALFKDEKTAFAAIAKAQCLTSVGCWNFDPGDCKEAGHDPLGCYPKDAEDIEKNEFASDYNECTTFTVTKSDARVGNDKTLKGGNKITPVKSFAAMTSCSSLHPPLLAQEALMMIYINVQTKDIISNTDMKEDVCPICLKSFDGEETVWMQCGHAVHAQCHANCVAHGHTQCSICRRKNSVAGTGCGKRPRSSTPV